MADDEIDVSQPAEEIAAQLTGATPAEDKTAEVVAKAEAELAAEDEDKPGDDGKPAADKSDRLQQLIDSKYGGDRDKFLEGIYEGWNSTSKLAKELAEIKEAIRPQAPPPTPEEIEHPDIPWLNQEIAALDAEAKSNQVEQQRLVKEGHDKQAEILQLKGELRRADEMDKEALQAKIERTETSLERLADRWKDYDSRNRRIEREKYELGRQKTFAEREVAAYKAEQLQLEKDDQAYKADERRKFNDAVDTAAEEWQIAKGTSREYMREVIRAEASLHLRSLPPGASAIDLPAFVKQRVEAYAQEMKLTRKADFQQLSKDKTAVSRPPAPKPAPPTPSSSPKVWSADYVRRRAAKLMP